MAELFVIINPYEDIIYAKAFDSTEKEYCTMYLIAYSCIDHFIKLRKESNEFFPCIEKQFCWNVTVYFLRNGMSFIFVNTRTSQYATVNFFESVESLFSQLFLLPCYSFEKYIEDRIFDLNIDEAYKNST